MNEINPDINLQEYTNEGLLKAAFIAAVVMFPVAVAGAAVYSFTSLSVVGIVLIGLAGLPLFVIGFCAALNWLLGNVSTVLNWRTKNKKFKKMMNEGPS